MNNLNVPKTNIILTLLKIHCCNKSIDNVAVTQQKNITMTKMKCDFKTVQARNPDVPQKALSERSQSYVTEGNLK